MNFHWSRGSVLFCRRISVRTSVRGSLPQTRLPVERAAALRPPHKGLGYSCVTYSRKRETVHHDWGDEEPTEPVHKFTGTRRNSGSGREETAEAGLGLLLCGSDNCLSIHTPWVSLSIVSRVDPALSTVKPETCSRLCLGPILIICHVSESSHAQCRVCGGDRMQRPNVVCGIICYVA